MVTVWRIDPNRPLRPPWPVPAQLKMRDKNNWAWFTDGTRGIVGQTVFLVEAEALKRWQGRLDRLRKDRYTQSMHPTIAKRADELCTSHVYKGRRPK